MKRISERLVEAKTGLVMSSALIYFIFFIEVLDLFCRSVEMLEEILRLLRSWQKTFTPGSEGSVLRDLSVLSSSSGL